MLSHRQRKLYDSGDLMITAMLNGMLLHYWNKGYTLIQITLKRGVKLERRYLHMCINKTTIKGGHLLERECSLKGGC